MSASLRRLAETDLERVMHWRMDPEITRYMYSDPQLTLADQLRWFAAINASEHDLVWIIEADQKPVGLLSLGDIDRTHQRCSWAYYLAEPEARGKGLAKALECNVCDFVFDILGLEKLWCEVLGFNDRVVKLHEMFGSKVEGVLRHHIRKGDAVHDVVRMGLLKHEWMEKRMSLHYDPIKIDYDAGVRP